MQGVAGWQPCALCVLQRIVLLAIAATALLGLTWRKASLASLALATLLSLGGVTIAAYQCWLVAHPVVVCGADPLGLAINASFFGRFLPWVFDSYGNCSIVPEFLGLPLSGWSLVLFGVQGAILGAACVRDLRGNARPVLR